MVLALYNLLQMPVVYYGAGCVETQIILELKKKVTYCLHNLVNHS